jgi:hypothetical protein
MTPATLVRLTVGGLLLAAPHRVLARIHAPDCDDPAVLVVARVLGARLVVQGALDVAAHGRFRRIGAAVEAAHAASMMPVVTGSPRHRRSAGTSAAVATGLALADLRESRDNA